MKRKIPNPGTYQKLKIKLTDGSEHEFVLVPGAQGKDGIVGLAVNIKGIVDAFEDLPDAADYAVGDGWKVKDNLWAIIDNGLHEWTDLGTFRGEQGDQGVGINLLGHFPNFESLPANANDFEPGDAWILSDSGYVYVCTPDEDNSEEEIHHIWVRVILGQQGEQGEQGKQGDPGTPGDDLNIDGAAENEEELRTKYPLGAMYNDGTKEVVNGTTFLADSHGWVMTDGEWVDAGVVLQGPEGKEGPQGKEGEKGDELVINGAAASVAELATTYKWGTVLEDGHVIGDGTTFLVEANAYVMTNKRWINGGPIRGVKGEEGKKGERGERGYRGNPGQRGQRGPTGSFKQDGACASIDLLPELPNAGFPEGFTMLVPDVDTKLAHAYVVTDDEWQDGGVIEGKQGKQGETGKTGAEGKPCIPIKVIETLQGEVDVDPLTILPDVESVEEGYGYFIEQPYADSENNPNELVLWARTEKLVNGLAAWTNFGSYRGIRGKQGIQGEEGKKGEHGEPGTFSFDDALESADLLPALPADEYHKGYSFLIPDADGVGHAWVSAGDRWVDTGKLQGVPGAQGGIGKTGDDGEDGLSAYQLWQKYGTEGPDDKEGWAAYLEAYRGEQGKQGIQGDIGPGIKILDYFDTQEQLEAVDTTDLTFGDGYLVGENFFAWVPDTSTWRDCGKVRGPEGKEGPQGKPGIQGKKGEQGERGAYWLIFSREPLDTDGRDYDCFLNISSMSAYMKTNGKWVYQGKMGGGNVYKTNSDGIIYVMQDGEWITLPVGEAPLAEDNPELADVPHVRQNGQWVRLDQYALPIFDTKGELDLAKGNCFNLLHSTKADIVIKNAPAKCVKVVTLYIDYDEGVIVWPSNIVWTHGEAPILPAVGSWLLVTMYVNEDKIIGKWDNS
ncbi:collagen-like protein [Kluyvera cryocrescens]|uniref:hypothetical protein n=1 Tax=Kluyvera cryocrescens TaxID=580 RepID=UPI002DBAF001|nr:hypothetical protein [Kluyvera cryocrescens]MEB7712765.1 collagen-like protein [Kluyvera cryocrescens]